MKVLLTGAFGNIGSSTLPELLERGHQVRCFDLETRSNRRAARRYQGRVELQWGDITRPADLRRAVEGQEAVVHLAYVIPRLSATGVNSEEAPEWAEAINVGGTRHLLQAIQDQSRPARILFASSLHVYGRTQHRPPPRTLDDPVQPTDHYARHKVACEELVRSSGLEWAIFRLGASLPVRLVLDPGMFMVPLDNRIELVHGRDVGLAIANALDNPQAWGKTWLIGGGPDCQIYQRELVAGVLEAVGVGMLPEWAFSRQPYATDWLDTGESQRVLRFQRYGLRDYIAEVRARVGGWRYLVRLFRPLVRGWLLSQASAFRASP